MKQNGKNYSIEDLEAVILCLPLGMIQYNMTPSNQKLGHPIIALLGILCR